jgi:hypothetical protein
LVRRAQAGALDEPLITGRAIASTELIARVVFGTPGFGLAFSAALLPALMLLWMVLPRLEARKNR